MKIESNMSESKSEMTPAVPVGNLKNRIDNNLKLSIPKTGLSFNSIRNHPSTAPAVTGLKELKNFMKSWDHDMSELGEDDYFVTTPGSIGTPTMKRKNFYPVFDNGKFQTFYYRAIAFGFAVYGDFEDEPHFAGWLEFNFSFFELKHFIDFIKILTASETGT